MSKIVIIGGHGKIALRLARILTAEGNEVSSLIRNPDHEADVRETGAAPVLADVENLSTEDIADKLRGHDAVVFSAGAGGGNPARTYAVDRDAAIRSIDAAQSAGVKRYVIVSYFGAGPDHGVPSDNSFFPYAEAKAAADERLRASDLDWTILGPSTLTEDEPTGKIELGPNAEKSTVSRSDVAQVAAIVLDTPDTSGKTIEFNNGETPISEAVASLR
ncbi:SDR family oxidoreductase [Rhodococcus sp. NPDC058521]|uniref:SDR family oxidoreductase n=1 Tax=Rhodococcus sp. NPDC058521 TaxID=3346536 RepID=UPI0036464CB6